MPKEEITPPQSSEQLLDYERLQQALCEFLFTNEVIEIAQIPTELVKDAQIHLATCTDNHHSVQGLYFQD